MSDRFEPYETTLRTTLSESKTALTEKGVSVPEETKLRNVPELIKTVKSGGGYYLLIKTDTNSGYVGGTITATQGDLSVTGNIENYQCKLEVPKSGVWNVKSSNTASSVTNIEVVDTFNGSLSCTCTATVSIRVTCDHLFNSDYHVYAFRPDGTQITVHNVSKGTGWDGGTFSFNPEKFGTYSLDWKVGSSSTFHGNRKYFTISENKAYSFNFNVVWGNLTPLDSSPGLNRPTIGDESVSQETQNNSNNFFYEVTNWTEDQQEEVRGMIQQMVEDNKTQDEIEAYIAQKEAEYGQV